MIEQRHLKQYYSIVMTLTNQLSALSNFKSNLETQEK